MICPDCEYHKQRAALWRHEAYRLGGTPLPWDADVAIAKAVAELAGALQEVFSDHDAVNRLSWNDRAAAALVKLGGKE